MIVEEYQMRSKRRRQPDLGPWIPCLLQHILNSMQDRKWRSMSSADCHRPQPEPRRHREGFQKFRKHHQGRYRNRESSPPLYCCSVVSPVTDSLCWRDTKRRDARGAWIATRTRHTHAVANLHRGDGRLWTVTGCRFLRPTSERGDRLGSRNKLAETRERLRFTGFPTFSAGV
jgi:hypothetical protein